MMLFIIPAVDTMSVPTIDVLPMQSVSLALIALGGTALTLSMPVLAAWLVNRNLAKIKREDNARQDYLREEEHERQDIIAKRITEAAERAERVARENASLLLMANAQIVASSLRNGEKLDVLKIQGDGQMTSIIQSELHIAKIALKSLQDGIAKDRALGNAPDADTLEEVRAIESRMIVLRQSIVDRVAVEKIVATMPGESSKN